jgi:hypothetical protein
MVYEPNILLMGSGVPHGPVPDILYPRTPALHTPHIGTTRTDDRAHQGANSKDVEGT